MFDSANHSRFQHRVSEEENLMAQSSEVKEEAACLAMHLWYERPNDASSCQWQCTGSRCHQHQQHACCTFFIRPRHKSLDRHIGADMSKIAHPHVDLSAVASAVWNTGCSWNDSLQLSQKRDVSQGSPWMAKSLLSLLSRIDVCWEV